MRAWPSFFLWASPWYKAARTNERPPLYPKLRSQVATLNSSFVSVPMCVFWGHVGGVTQEGHDMIRNPFVEPFLLGCLLLSGCLKDMGKTLFVK